MPTPRPCRSASALSKLYDESAGEGVLALELCTIVGGIGRIVHDRYRRPPGRCRIPADHGRRRSDRKPHRTGLHDPDIAFRFDIGRICSSTEGQALRSWDFHPLHSSVPYRWPHRRSGFRGVRPRRWAHGNRQSGQDDSTMGRRRRSADRHAVVGHTGTVGAVVFGPDGRRLSRSGPKTRPVLHSPVPEFTDCFQIDENAVSGHHPPVNDGLSRRDGCGEQVFRSVGQSISKSSTRVEINHSARCSPMPP